MHIIFIRHGSRIDKSNPGISPSHSSISFDLEKKSVKVDIENELELESSNWLSNFDPPLNETLASYEMDNAFMKIQNNIFNGRKHKTSRIMIHSSPYNRCIQTSELLLDKIQKFKLKEKEKIDIKLRVDQALSEWLNENYNLKYLPPNDDGYSMINNVNAYLNQDINDSNCKGEFSSKTRSQLKDVKDFTWSYNQLGHCGEYGESASAFTRRCFNYLIYLLQFYYMRQNSEADKNMIVFVVSHGAIISTLLQILLGRSVFNEIPLCSPIYFKQSEKRRSVFKLMDYDFNLNQLLSPSSDTEFYKILDTPIDLTKLDSNNLRSELTIGTSGYTTIIQSLPRTLESPKNNKTRKRRNTINIGDKEKDENKGEGLESLKYTRSSKQLYLLNKDTSEEKVIDLNKLHSYFGSGSESEDGDEDEEEYGGLNINLGKRYSSGGTPTNNKNNNKNNKNKITLTDDKEKDYYEDNNDNDNNNDNNVLVSINDFDDKGKSLSENVYKGSITSLSSFNEENKSKFQLNEENFYSKTSPIIGDPYSHFFLNGEKDNDEIYKDEFNMSATTSQNGSISNTIEFNGDFKRNNGGLHMSDNRNGKIGISIWDSEDEDGDGDGESNDNDSIESDDRNVLSFDTRAKVEKIMDKDNLKKEEGNGGSSGNNSGSNVRLMIPKLISTRNMDLLVRGNDTNSKSHESVGGYGNSRENELNALKRLLEDSKMMSSDDESEDSEEDGWFGGFS